MLFAAPHTALGYRERERFITDTVMETSLRERVCG
jgi:hypothetical protein